MLSDFLGSGYKPAGKVAGVNEGARALVSLRMVAATEALAGGFLDSPVHALKLPVAPRRPDPGQAVLNTMVFANPGEDMPRAI